VTSVQLEHGLEHLDSVRRRQDEPRAKSHAILARVLSAGGDPEPKRRTAHELLLRFGSLEGIAQASSDQLLLIEPLTAQDLAVLETLRDVVGLFRDDDDSPPVIQSPRVLHAYLVKRHDWPSVGTATRAILLDHTLRLVGDVEVEHGQAPTVAAHALAMETQSRQAAGVILVRLQASARTDLPAEFRATLKHISDSLRLLGVTIMQVAAATPTDLFRLL
jgi:DNA repair protein RadC